MTDADSIKDAARDIVGQPQYRVVEPGMAQRALDWVGDQLQVVIDAFGRLLARLANLVGFSVGGVAGAGGGGFVLGWIVLALAAGAIVWFLVRVMPRRRLRSEKKMKPTVEQRSRHRTTRREWLERAALAEAERDFTGAVRARYRALAAGLAERNELENDDAVTSGEHLRSFDGEPHRKDRLTKATTTYERAWFGEQPVDLSDSGELEGIDRELMDGRRS